MNQIRKTLAKLGVLSSYKGCEQIELALHLVMEEGYKLSAVMQIYREVARRMGVTPISVERNIRTIIDRAWAVDPERISDMAGYWMCAKPKAREFMAILINYIQAD